MIEGARTKNLRVVQDERGWLMKILRCDDGIFSLFGQVCLTTVYHLPADYRAVFLSNPAGCCQAKEG